MKKEIELSEDAQNDLKDASEWYDEQKTGLGNEFLEEVQKAFETIESNPYQFQKVKGNIRRSLVNRFSYGVFYVIRKFNPIP